MIADRPTLAFLFTDIQGSTPLWEAHPVTMVRSRELHDQLLHDLITGHDGDVFGTAGDSFAATFTDAHQAVAAAVAIQQAFADAPWAPGPPLRVRIGIHVGEIEIRDGKLLGPTVNTAARVGDSGHGGQIVISESVLVATGVAAIPLGTFRFKGVADHMRLYQVGEGAFPALRAVDDRLTNLSPAVNNLVGRSAELHRLSDLIDAHRLVTLTGVGGVGKTRLAEAAALRRMGAHSDGVWIADLSRASDSSSVLSGVAASLNVAAADFERLANLVAGHDLLLVLDNCEHVIDDVFELCEVLLSNTSRLRIVATSREGVGIPGEHVMVVRPLTIDDGAPQLFIERAAQAGVDLDTDQHRSAVLEICERLDGIPLALELAAATTRKMSPRDIADRLDERFTLLRGTGRRGGIERHQTLRAAVDWSYSRLDPVQQQFLRRLGVFSGGVAIDAAEAMAKDLGESAINLLGDLVDRSLISAQEADSRSRYVLLETIRQYALDRLVDHGETDEVTRRHAEWCLDFARRAAAAAHGPAEFTELRRLFREASNFRVALSWAVDSGNSEIAIDLLLALEDLSYISSTIAELAGPVVGSGIVEGHPEADRLMAIELIRRAMSDGSTERVSLAQQVAGRLSAESSSAVTLMAGLLIGTALQVFDDASIADRIIARADRTRDPREQARLLVAALIVTAYIGDPVSFGPLLERAAQATESVGMQRLSITVASMACLQGLRDGDTARALEFSRPILRHLDELPSPSIMSSGLTVMYTENAVRANAPADDRYAAIRRLRPVLHGDFDRLGLALARLVEQAGELPLAVRALGACTASSRSGFSVEQRNSIMEHAIRELGGEQVQRLLSNGRSEQRSDLYREMWAYLAPIMLPRSS